MYTYIHEYMQVCSSIGTDIHVNINMKMIVCIRRRIHVYIRNSNACPYSPSYRCYNNVILVYSTYYPCQIKEIAIILIQTTITVCVLVFVEGLKWILM